MFELGFKGLSTVDRRLLTTNFLLISSYIAGLVGFLFIPGFEKLTWFSLLLSFGLVVWNHEPKNAGFYLFLILAWIVGFSIEVAGVATGKIFGVYAYGDIMGPKAYHVPLLIGINWAVVVYLGNELTGRYFGNMPLLVRTSLAALIPTLLDVIIEPVAIQTGMWHWYGSVPPLQNYLAWYAVSWLLSLAYQRWVGKAVRNPASPLLFILQVVFFLVLGIVR